VSADKFKNAVAQVLKFEGGYVNDPADPGGETNRGITIATARRGGYTGDMKSLSEKDALFIYLNLYWKPLRLDTIDATGLRLVMFDSAVNMGISWPALWLQEVLNDQSNNGSRWKRIVEDGLIGPITIGITNTATVTPGGASAIMAAILNSRLARYQYLIRKNPALAKFDNGWKNRVASLRSMIQHPDMRMAKGDKPDEGSKTA